VYDPSADTYTFLFTDIEGSTKLWERAPDAMDQALARHDELLRRHVVGSGGDVFKTIGDAFCAVFTDPTSAVHAALGAQLDLRRLEVEPGVPLRVRMALHSGPATRRDHDYFGPTLNQVARLLAVAHGGQILLSDACMDRVGDALETMGATGFDLGVHRLRDISQLTHVFQLHHPSLPSDFPPLRSPEGLPNNLPRELSSFIGREAAIRDVKELLNSTRLLTLTGAGGCGKTRLAIEVAYDVLPEYESGVWLVELAALTDASQVPQAILNVLKLHEELGRPATQTLTDYLRNLHCLIVLDNCEHLIEACAQVTNELLTHCAKLHILATSREALGIGGERSWQVPSLATPADTTHMSLECLAEFESIRLFVDRALTTHGDFQLTEDNAGAVTSIVQRLDGIPLAIELAAARTKALTVEQLSARLDDRFRLLTGGSRTALPRQQTLEATIDWSYNLLSGPEQLLCRRLAVFAGGWTLEAAEHVAAGNGIEDYEIMDLMSQLVDKSLVQYEQSHGEGRYRFLETVRQYCRDKLFDSEEALTLRRRHMDYYRALVAKIEPLLGGAEQVHWMQRLGLEHDNLRSAFEWSQAEPDGPELALRLAKSLHRFWEVRGHLSEGRAWLERGLASAPPQVEDLRMRALNALGALCYEQADYEAARAAYRESLQIATKLDFRRGIAILENNLGNVATNQGLPHEAREHFETSVAICRELEDRQNLGFALDNLAAVYCDLGEHDLAARLHAESMPIFESLGDTRSIGIALYRMANLERRRGNREKAREGFFAALGVHQDLGFRAGIASCLEGLGMLQFELGRHALATQLISAAAAIRQNIGSRLPKWIQAELDTCLAQCRNALGQADFEHNQTLGRQTGVKELIATISPEV
jgi:predicted ATPase/class 3 adenylate cyclase